MGFGKVAGRRFELARQKEGKSRFVYGRPGGISSLLLDVEQELFLLLKQGGSGSDWCLERAVGHILGKGGEWGGEARRGNGRHTGKTKGDAEEGEREDKGEGEGGPQGRSTTPLYTKFPPFPPISKTPE